MSDPSQRSANQVTEKVRRPNNGMSKLAQADDFNSFLWWWNNHSGRTSVEHLDQLEGTVQHVLDEANALNQTKQESFEKNEDLNRKVETKAQTA